MIDQPREQRKDYDVAPVEREIAARSAGGGGESSAY